MKTRAAVTSPDTPVRLQKFLAAAAVASRRHSEVLLRAGRVTVNGNTARLGDRVDPARDRVALDGRLIRPPPAASRAYILYKPRGRVCTRTSGEGRTVFELLPDVSGAALRTAGRLDKDSEGALLLSDNGDWIHRWTHPSFGHEKVYHVTVSGSIRGETFKLLNSSMTIDGYQTRPARVRLLRSANRPGRMIIEFVLREGRNRQIRKMCEQAGLAVHRLKRISIGPLTLSGLKPGQWRLLTEPEIRILCDSAGRK